MVSYNPPEESFALRSIETDPWVLKGWVGGYIMTCMAHASVLASKGVPNMHMATRGDRVNHLCLFTVPSSEVCTLLVKLGVMLPYHYSGHRSHSDGDADQEPGKNLMTLWPLIGY